MRVTNNLLVRDQLAALQSSAQAMSKAQRQVTSGLRVATLADDPAVALQREQAAQATIAALEQLHAKVRRTDRDGAISVVATNHSLTVSTENAKPHLIRWN